MRDLPMDNVLSCEIDRYARATFLANFSDLPCIKNDNYPTDIRTLNPSEIPPFDILVGSPPCQSFSMAGLRRGLLDKKDDKGNMFFYVLNIIKAHRPKAFILENVKGLLTAEGGRSFRIISDLFKNAGYSFDYKVIKGSDCGVPQMRQRVFMVGFRNDIQSPVPFEFPAPVPLKFTMREVLGCNECNREVGYTLLTYQSNQPITSRYNWRRYIADGKEVKIGIPEMRKMMSIPDSFVFPVSDNQAFKQLGNGIIPECVHLVASQVIKYLQGINA